MVAAYISGRKAHPSANQIVTGMEIAQHIRSQHPLPQFPHGDYVGMSFDLAHELHTLPTDEEITVCPIITPLSFSSSTATEVAEVKELVQQDLLTSLTHYHNGKNVGKFILYALEGNEFTLHREILEKENLQSNTVTGKVSFQRIQRKDNNKLWYHEEGMFHTANGGTFEVSQSYIYQWNEELEALEIFFSVVGKPTEIDRHFLTLKCHRTAAKGQD